MIILHCKRKMLWSLMTSNEQLCIKKRVEVEGKNNGSLTHFIIHYNSKIIAFYVWGVFVILHGALIIKGFSKSIIIFLNTIK